MSCYFISVLTCYPKLDLLIYMFSYMYTLMLLNVKKKSIVCIVVLVK